MNAKAKDKEPKAILDVTTAGTDMVQRKDIFAFMTGLKYKATNGRSEDAILAQQLLQDTNNHYARKMYHACAQGHVQSSCNSVAN